MPRLEKIAKTTIPFARPLDAQGVEALLVRIRQQTLYDIEYTIEEVKIVPGSYARTEHVDLKGTLGIPRLINFRAYRDGCAQGTMFDGLHIDVDQHDGKMHPEDIKVLGYVRNSVDVYFCKE
ncbi:hypothetical protein HY642_02100 [Candidatus Woesearchaeota archaeon]|nr:hypothetical protein [Candidatus Woesearchaeota archaeon]